MPHHDGLPLVFQFPEEDTLPESQEHKALWDELELALREDAAPVPAPVPAAVAPTAPAPIPVALMGWEPHIVVDLDATGFHEVPCHDRIFRILIPRKNGLCAHQPQDYC